MTNHKKPAEPVAAKPEDEEVAPAATASEMIADDTPSPTQAEMDEVRLALGRSAPYQTREAKAE